MARPSKQTADYFPHDANACSGDTLTVLQNRFGNDGYAFWFKLMEKLTSSDGHYIDVRAPTKWQLFIARMGVNEITTVEIMVLLVEMQAIDKDLWQSKLIWCQDLVDDLADVYKNRRREIPSKPVITGNNPITTTETPIPTGNNPITTRQTKVKEKRGNESKVNNNAHFNTFWEAYPKKRGKGNAEKVFRKLKPSEELLAMMVTAIEEQKNKRAQAKGFFPEWKDPERWLKAKGWEDEMEAEQDGRPGRGTGPAAQGESGPGTDKQLLPEDKFGSWPEGVRLIGTEDYEE